MVKMGGKADELVCTAQLEVTVQANGKTACVPVIVQPDSEQACLLITDTTSLLGQACTHGY